MGSYVLTSVLVIGLWNHMKHKFGSRVKGKEDSDFMRVVGGALDLMGVLDKETFLQKYCTTIRNTIYVPFAIGSESATNKGWGLLSQILLCAHEHQHVVQDSQEGLAFGGKYLLDAKARALYEAEAMVAELEVLMWFSGSLPEGIETHMAEKLENYAVGAEDRSVVATYLQSCGVTVMAGGLITEAGREAVNWLTANV